MPQITNSTVTPYYSQTSGELITYQIRANYGYVLHDSELDILDIDPFTEEEISRLAGFTSATCSCSADYDWEANPREFYAIFESEIPANQIFGGNYNDHGA